MAAAALRWARLACLVLVASCSTLAWAGELDPAAQAIWMLRKYTDVMDLSVSKDRELRERLLPAFAALLEQHGAALERGDTPLLQAAIRSIYRAQGHVTKDSMMAGHASTLNDSVVEAVAGDFLYDMLRVIESKLDMDKLLRRSDADGLTAIHLATLFRQHALLRRLLALPAAAEMLAQPTRGLFGMTALHIAVVNSDAAATHMLLAAGAPTTAFDAFGRTAHAIARIKGDASLADAVAPPVCAAHPFSRFSSSLPPLRPRQRMAAADAASRRWRDDDGATADVDERPPGPHDKAPACDVDILDVDSLSADRFLRDYASIRRPVVVRGATRSWAARDAWTRDSLLRRHGDLPALTGRIPYAAIFGEQHDHVALGHFIAYMDALHASPATPAAPPPQYIFDSEDKFIEAVFGAAENALPSFLAPWIAQFTRFHQFMLGPRASGAPMHYHCDAVNFVVYGRKRWFLVPPAYTYYSKLHPTTLHVSELPPGACELTQEQGDTVYVPGFWGHAVVNQAETVGIAVEFDRRDC